MVITLVLHTDLSSDRDHFFSVLFLLRFLLLLSASMVQSRSILLHPSLRIFHLMFQLEYNPFLFSDFTVDVNSTGTPVSYLLSQDLFGFLALVLGDHQQQTHSCKDPLIFRQKEFHLNLFAKQMKSLEEYGSIAGAITHRSLTVFGALNLFLLYTFYFVKY